MTTLTQPIAKLYKRCARNHHDSCPGSFETWSVCSCDCHAGVSDMRAATTMPVKVAEMPVTCADKAEAVSEAIAIVKRTVKTKAKASGLSTKTDKFAKWANAIVAKNARLNAAVDVNRERLGYLPLKEAFDRRCPALDREIISSIPTPKCEDCTKYMHVDRRQDGSIYVKPCGCKEGK